MKSLIMITTLFILTLMSISLKAQSFDSDDAIINEVMKTVDWTTICIESPEIPLITDSLNCPAAHPASLWHNKRVMDRAITQLPESIDICNVINQENVLFRQQIEDLNDGWKLCKKMFETSLSRRLSHPNEFHFELDDWVYTAFNIELQGGS